MHRVNWKSPRITLFSSALFLAMGSVAPVVVEAQQPTRVTVFEGATPPHPSRTQHSLLKTAGSPPQQQAALHRSSQKTGCSAIHTSMAEKACAATTTGRPQNKQHFLSSSRGVLRPCRGLDPPRGGQLRCAHWCRMSPGGAIA